VPKKAPAAPTHRTAAEVFGVPEPPRDTRERILYTALDLFYAFGFHEVGLDRILETVGVTKTTFYNHFESRDHLILDALEMRERWEGRAMERGMRERAGYDPKALLVAQFEVLDEWFNHPDYQGCIFVLACAEFPLPSHPVHKRAAEGFHAAEEQVRGLAKAAGVRDPEGFARQYVMLLQGALTRRLVSRDDGAARAARDVVARLLDAEGVGAPATKPVEPASEAGSRTG
jgi:AcrR family transcriptional regulator